MSSSATSNRTRRRRSPLPLSFLDQALTAAGVIGERVKNLEYLSTIDRAKLLVRCAGPLLVSGCFYFGPFFVGFPLVIERRSENRLPYEIRQRPQNLARCRQVPAGMWSISPCNSRRSASLVFSSWRGISDHGELMNGSVSPYFDIVAVLGCHSRPRYSPAALTQRIHQQH